MNVRINKYLLVLGILIYCGSTNYLFAQKKDFAIFGYYSGRVTMIDSFSVEKLTHLSYSFTHLKGNKISLSNAKDSATLMNCVAQKKRNPKLKVIVSMGGWTGCYTCSEVFAEDSSRKRFASSTKKLLLDFGADGIDLDWEYPTIKGAPGHPYSLKDKKHFTSLIQTLRDTLGEKYEISFAAGGFPQFINEAIDWDKVTPLVNRINIMTYDLITGFDTVTGHHTGLYSTDKQTFSCDNAVKMLIAKGVPANKLLIGAAFYGRLWERVSAENNGLYAHGNFVRTVSYKNLTAVFSRDSGFVYNWDEQASAPYIYHPTKKLFFTYDDSVSVALKTRYCIKNKLNGIMFWQIVDDSFSNGLLNVMEAEKKKKRIR